MVETYVIMELYKTALNTENAPEFYYWRDQHGSEIDLILVLPDGTTLPIEIKAGQTVTKNMYTALLNWCTLAQVERGILYYGGNQDQTRTQIRILPIATL